MTISLRIRRDTLWRILSGCALAIFLSGAAVGAQIKPKPRPTPRSDDEIILSCWPCWLQYPEWWCRWVWNCPPKPDNPPPSEQGAQQKPKK
jgi:hypothetical protein